MMYDYTCIKFKCKCKCSWWHHVTYSISYALLLCSAHIKIIKVVGMVFLVLAYHKKDTIILIQTFEVLKM